MKSFGQRDVKRAVPLTVTPPPEQSIREPAQHDAIAAINLRDRVLRQIDPAAAAAMPTEQLERQVEGIIHDIANTERLELSGVEQAQLAHDLASDMTGFGPLQSLLLDETVNDIMVNGPNKVYVERSGKIERTAVRFRDNIHIAAIGQKIASRVGRRIDESSPMVDCRLQDGSRVNIIFPHWRSTVLASRSASFRAGALTLPLWWQMAR